MEIISIKELFAFAKPTLVPETVTFGEKQAKVWFQRMSMEDSAGIGRPFLSADGSGIDKDKIALFQATLLVETVRDEAGNKVLDVEDVLKADSGLYRAMQVLAEKHNPAGSAAVEATAKNSETTSSSATS